MAIQKVFRLLYEGKMTSVRRREAYFVDTPVEKSGAEEKLLAGQTRANAQYSGALLGVKHSKPLILGDRSLDRREAA